MLSSLSSDEIKQAIISEDVRTVQSIKGIGAKTAARTIIELKDKLKKEVVASGVNPTVFASQNLTLRSEALTALTTLGIPKAAAEKNVDTILRRTGGDVSLEELIKLALR
jgi:Holliday junction DNA helicase RuvA